MTNPQDSHPADRLSPKVKAAIQQFMQTLETEEAVVSIFIGVPTDTPPNVALVSVSNHHDPQVFYAVKLAVEQTLAGQVTPRQGQ